MRGLGRDERTGSDAVNKLPSAISLGFMPFDGSAQELASKARERGHEVIVQLPLEPSDYPVNNPGPETLLSGSSADENVARLSSILSRFEGYSGVTNFLGGKLLQSKTALRPILESLKSRELIYVGEGNSHAVVRGIAGEIGLRYGGADVIIDSNPIAGRDQEGAGASGRAGPQGWQRHRHGLCVARHHRRTRSLVADADGRGHHSGAGRRAGADARSFMSGAEVDAVPRCRTAPGSASC